MALALPAWAQYCVPTSAIPYAATMPGITHVVLNTIDRTSGDLEHYPNNNYTLTGLSTDLVKGQSYTMTIAFTIDAQICPHMNLRVWIDLNEDGQLDDPGETLLSMDHQVNSYTGTITIPASTPTGTTRMRVTAKMCSHGGHTLPTPCDQPHDILGYHGEIEDYTVNIVDAVGIQEPAAPAIADLRVAPDPVSDAAFITYTLNGPGPLRIDVLDAAGRMVATLDDEAAPVVGEHRTLLDAHALGLKGGLYLVRLESAGGKRIERFLVVGG